MAGPRRLFQRAAILVGAAALFGGGIALYVLRPWEKPVPTQVSRIDAEIELAAGEVLLEHASGSQRLLSHTPVPAGARVRTGEGARALIRLSDGSRAFLDAQTVVTLGDGGDGLTLERGRAWLDAPALERGAEPTVHALGTDVKVSLAEGGASLRIDDDETSVYVAAGLAIVDGAAGRREVAAGERAVLGDDGAPTVEAVAFWEDWTGGMGDRSALGRTGALGSGALFAVDRSAPAGSPALPLAIQRQTVKVAFADALAETMVDQRFFNPSNRPVEGWYWFTIPEGAQLVGFTLETDGRLVDGEIVERHDAAAKYERAVVRNNDPALLEWIDARTVRARIFPVPALGSRRIIVRYQQLLAQAEGKLHYSYPLAGAPGRATPTIEEFALQVDLGVLGEQYEVATLGEARLEGDGAAKRVTMRRSGYAPRADFQLELTRKADVELAPMRLALLDPGGDQGRFAMLRWAPDLQLGEAAVPAGEVVVVVDTSAAGDPAEYLARVAAAEALLRSLSAGDKFAVMSADLDAEVLFPTTGVAEATEESIGIALERLAAHATGGATDLGAIFDTALERVHGLEQPAIVYIGDGLATSGDRRGEPLVERVRRSMAGSRARLFTVAVGRQVDGPVLERLAEVGGGTFSRVESNELAVARALELAGALKTPVLTDLAIDVGEGLDDVFTNVNGKIARGQELVLFARTHHDLPKAITVRGRLGGEAFSREYEVTLDDGAIVQAVPKLWAAAHIEHLLTDSRGVASVRGQVLSLGLEYGLMSPFTSLLALDSEQAYAQMGVQRRSRRFGGVRLVGDASLMPTAEPGPTRGSAVLAGVAAALTAPLGCSAKETPTAAAEAPRADAAPAPASAPGGAAGPNRQAGDSPAEPQVSPRPAPAIAEPTPDDAEPVQEELAERPRELDGEKSMGSKNEPAKPTSGYVGGADHDVPDAPPPALTPATKTPEAPPAGDEVTARPVARTHSNVTRGIKAPCSDAAAQDLGQRKLLWERRLALAADITATLEVYEAVASSCEMPGWKDQRTMLQLVQARANSEADIAMLLGHFADDSDARSYLARALLRRLVDPALVGAVGAAMFGEVIDWPALDRKLRLQTDAAEQLRLLRVAMTRAPGDPEGERRMIRMLAARGQRAEAIARGRKVREQGWFTPALAQSLGELLVEDGQIEEAQRVFSEIVEFDPDSFGSRRLLGDIFLRHGWYDGAYRQYEDLTELQPDDMTAAIRLARAAAGAGRIDEGLRILRKIAAEEGRPGADDPRRFARLHAAAYLAAMLAAEGTPKASIAQELRRLQLFDAPTTLTLVTWHDLEASLVLARTDEIAVDAIAATDTGLFALQTDGAAPPVTVRHAGADHARTVAYERIVITFDGKNFEVVVEPGEIGPAVPTAE